MLTTSAPSSGSLMARAPTCSPLLICGRYRGLRTRGDPHLAASEQVMIAAPCGAQAHADHIGAGLRLAHGQGADMFAADQLRQVTGFFFQAEDGIRALYVTGVQTCALPI